MLIEKDVLQVLHYLMTIMDRIDIAQGPIKKRFQIVFRSAGRDGFYYLIKI